MTGIVVFRKKSLILQRTYVLTLNFTVMGFLLWILYGLAAGACASWLLGSSHEWYWNIIIGIIGSIVGGFVAGLFGIKSNNWIGSFVISVVGAVICLLLYNYLA